MNIVPCSVGLYDDLPRRLYKFMTALHAENTVRSGVFRIGSLAEYRNVELFQDDIGDAGEGTAVLKDSRMAMQNEETMSWPMRQIFKTEPNTGITIQNCTARIDWTLDLYVYCMHGSNGRTLSASPNYDTCIEIRDPLAFLDALSGSLQLGDARAGKCRYIDRDHEVVGASPPPVELLKPERYGYQDEWRFVWPSTRRHPAESFNVLCREATKFCRIVPFAR
jgi:hypothetical protein